MMINNYMTPTEAANRWKIGETTLKDRLNGRNPTAAALARQLASDGLIKSYLAPGRQRKEWIVTVAAMETLYGPEPEK